MPVVDLPLGATEDRVVGALDLEQALSQGIKKLAPGLLAQANRGFLYIDEVNLLADHIVDLLIDVAASGENLVEREGLSVRHTARFVLVGSGNPEEGELRHLVPHTRHRRLARRTDAVAGHPCLCCTAGGQGGRAQARENAQTLTQHWRLTGYPSLWIDTAPQPEPQAQNLANLMGANYFPISYVPMCKRNAWPRWCKI